MEADTPPRAYRPTLPLTRTWFLTAVVLNAVAAVQLFLLADATATYFAWTITPSLTAAFLGASYCGGGMLSFLASRERWWANARVALYGVFAFTVLASTATLLHLDRFHLGDPHPLSAVAAGWAWLAVYLVAPLWQLAAIITQHRLRQPDPPRQRPLPLWARPLLAGQCAVLMVAGVVLFTAPGAAGAFWPWPLTPLTARAVGAWLVGISVVFGQMWWENDIARTRVAIVAGAVLVLMHVLVVVRFADGLDWSRSAAWFYLLVILSGLPYVWLAARVLRRPASAADKTTLVVD